jgi:hypothetical protein
MESLAQLQGAAMASISERVNQAFGSRDSSTKKVERDPIKEAERREQLSKYLDYIKEADKEAIGAIRRNLLLALLAAVAFLLFQTQTIEKIDIGPIELATGSKLTVFLTSMSAYFFLETAIAIPNADRKRAAFSEVFAIWNREAHNARLDQLVYAKEPSYFATLTAWPAEKDRTSFDRIYEKWIAGPLAVGIAFLPFAFEIYAFIVLFAGFGRTDWTVWLNLVITSILLAGATSVVIAALSSPT